MDKLKRKIRKYYEFIITKIKLLLHQKKYKQDNVTVKYMYKAVPGSNDLVVVLSSCTRKGIRARYNYMRTLADIKANRLFILDDYADDHRGSYYMGPDFTFAEEKATLGLIDSFVERLNCRKVIFCGSSKGGYSALNFGLQREGSYIVAGAPQYFLKTYLETTENTACLNHIMGARTPEKEQTIEFYMQERIRNTQYKGTQHIFLNFSDKEHTYNEHVAHLLKELKENNYDVECSVDDYTDHSDISIYFPDYLKKTVQRILGE